MHPDRWFQRLISIEEEMATGFDCTDDQLRTAVVRTKIFSDTARRVPLEFGFSDYLHMYLNRQLLYSGENRIREDDKRYQGLVNPNATVVLNLARGENELALVLREGDRFGWGFLTELVELDGLTLQQIHEPLARNAPS